MMFCLWGFVFTVCDGDIRILKSVEVLILFFCNQSKLFKAFPEQLTLIAVEFLFWEMLSIEAENVIKNM